MCPQVTDYVPTETHDNSWNLCHGYMSTDIKKHDLEQWFKNAFEDPNDDEDEDGETKHKRSKEGI